MLATVFLLWTLHNKDFRIRNDDNDLMDFIS
jgi:hypothetical protein